MRFSPTPPEKSNGSRGSIPGIPFGIFVKGAFGPAFLLPLSSVYLKGAWSDENTWKTPRESAFQIAAWLDESRGGGEHTHLAPSKPSFSRTSAERKRY